MSSRAFSFVLLTSAALLVPVAAQAAAKATLRDRFDQIVATFTGDPAAGVDVDMKHVLDAWRSLNPKPFEKLSPDEARRQPAPIQGAAILARNMNRPLVADALTVKQITVPGPAGPLAARVYAAQGGAVRPMVVFFHGGGFVMDNPDGADASARAIATAGYVVVAPDYRLAPEAKFPAAADDCAAAYKWLSEHAGDLGGDPDRVALAGEGAGGLLAANAAIAARDGQWAKPAALVLITPIAGIDFKTNSWLEDSAARPWNKAAVEWALKLFLPDPGMIRDARIDLVGAADMHNLPPTTIITAEIDPLRSDGERLGGKLKRATVPVFMRDYAGVTHDFFGMGEVVDKAAMAQDYVAAELKRAFAPPANQAVALEDLGIAPYPEAANPAVTPPTAVTTPAK